MNPPALCSVIIGVPQGGRPGLGPPVSICQRIILVSSQTGQVRVYRDTNDHDVLLSCDWRLFWLSINLLIIYSIHHFIYKMVRIHIRELRVMSLQKLVLMKIKDISSSSIRKRKTENQYIGEAEPADVWYLTWMTEIIYRLSK